MLKFVSLYTHTNTDASLGSFLSVVWIVYFRFETLFFLTCTPRVDTFISTVAGVLQFRGGTQTVGKVGKVINYKGSHRYVWSETRHVSIWTWSGGPREDSSKSRCFWRILTLWQMWQKPTPTPCPGLGYLTHRDMFLSPKKHRVEIWCVSLLHIHIRCQPKTKQYCFSIV